MKFLISFSFLMSLWLSAPGAWAGPLSPLCNGALRQASEVRKAVVLEIYDTQGNSFSADLNLFTDAKFVVGTEPRTSGQIVLRNQEFGFKKGFAKAKFIGTLNYLVLSSSGQVLEVGGGSPEVLSEFRRSIFGRRLSSGELKTIADINHKLLADLRADPFGKKKLQEFAQSRGWPAGLEDEGGLAYFNGDINFIRWWARRNHYSLEQMRDAGWLGVEFDRQGKPRYHVIAAFSIKIPYFNEAEEIPVWRSRNLSKNPDAPRYLSWPLDRSIKRQFTVEETLYNGTALKNAEGKTVVITEGEFKCLLANHSGVLTVGIPGITQIDAAIIKGLIASRAKEFVIILDRDPKGKGLMNVDDVTDSQRAAYTIASDLIDAGAPQVRIGILPDVFDGGKVGIDDLIVAKGKQPFLDTVAYAMTRENYAKAISLDTKLMTLYMARKKLAKIVDDSQGVKDARYIEAKKALTTLNRGYHLYLDQRFNHATSLDQHSARFDALPLVNTVSDTVSAVDGNGQTLAASVFSNEILLLGNYGDGILTHDFPADEYTFRAGIRLSGSQESVQIPTVIFKKKNGKAVAFAGTNDTSRIRRILRSPVMKFGNTGT